MSSSGSTSTPTNLTTTLSLSSIQKSKNKKNVNLLPKTQLLQIFMENHGVLTSNAANNNLNQTSSKTPKVLPRFSNQDITKHLNQLTSSNNETVTSQTLSQIKKRVKEKKFKELTRICLNQQSNQYQTTSNTHNNNIETMPPLNQNLNAINSILNEFVNENNNLVASIESNNLNLIQETNHQFKNKQALISYLARDFFLDCKQRLDLSTFRILLNYLTEFKDSFIDLNNNKEQLDKIYELFKGDKSLCNKFSAFLTCETALHYDLFVQSSQYEKCYEFFNKLELFIPNKLTFKKLVQSIILSSSQALENETVSNRIDEIKTKIRSIIKNNAYINIELDYLFDQRRANLEPTYEKISFLDKLDSTTSLPTISLNDSTDNFNSSSNIDAEHIDLTNSYPIDYGTKKCSCKCHTSSSNFTNLDLTKRQEEYTSNQFQHEQHQQQKITEQDESDYLLSSYFFNQFNHCIICSLKLIKGKLVVKTEGKKAMPLVYKID